MTTTNPTGATVVLVHAGGQMHPVEEHHPVLQRKGMQVLAVLIPLTSL
jgi:hypothetical protein